ncbi:MAG: PTS sugar transporter subunit IIA [Terracidiphilus sp.]
MSILSAELIRLRASAADKQDAIRQAGALLVAGGRVLPEYVEGMLAREQSMSTCLGNGVAIPHGIFENRGHILATGISVLQLAEAVPWDEGETVRLVIGIAASADEHVGVLANLAEAIEDEARLGELLATEDPQAVVKILGATHETA